MQILLLGPQGSGKGTQGARIAERYGVPHISTGELLRAHVDLGTETGRAAQASMERGDLVPDLHHFASDVETSFDELHAIATTTEVRPLAGRRVSSR